MLPFKHRHNYTPGCSGFMCVETAVSWGGESEFAFAADSGDGNGTKASCPFQEAVGKGYGGAQQASQITSGKQRIRTCSPWGTGSDSFNLVETTGLEPVTSCV